MASEPATCYQRTMDWSRELEARPAPDGRRFVARRRARLGDVDHRGLARLDALARWLQDVAWDDAADAGLDQRYSWVVRRTVVEVRRPARFFEALELTTSCVSAGSHSALRRTEVRGELGAEADAVTLWVSVEPTGVRPRRLGDDFWATWGSSAGGRRPSTRALLTHQVLEGAHRVPWTARAADVDSFGHVNNAVYWAALAEATSVERRTGAEDRLVAVVEHRVPIPAGADVELWTLGEHVWLVADGTVAASGLVAAG